MKRSGFTMIEMVMSVVIMGILASMVLPRVKRDITQEAADNVLSAIRYTQHLALTDHKMEPTDRRWLRTLWHIRFASYTATDGTKWFYTISSSRDHDANVDMRETATDPSNGKLMYHRAGDSEVNDNEDESPNIFLGKKYGVDNITFSGGCASVQHIAFDHLGRPHVGIYTAGYKFSTYMKEDCIITFEFEDSDYDPFQIQIRAETGYANIIGQKNS